MATKVRAVSCNVVRKNNPASKSKASKSKCGCPKKNPANADEARYAAEVRLAWQKKDGAWTSQTCISVEDAEKKAASKKGAWAITKGTRTVRKSNPIGESIKKAAKHVGKKAAAKGKELGARAGAATKRAAKAAGKKVAAKSKEYGSRAAAATKKAAKAAGRKAVEKGKEYGARAGAATKRVAKKAAAKGAEVGKRAAKRTARKVAGTARGAAAGLVKGWKENPTGVYKQTFKNGDEIYFVAETQQKNRGWAGHMVRFEKGRAQKPKRTSVCNFDLWTRVTTADVPTKVLEKFGVKVNPSVKKGRKSNPTKSMYRISAEVGPTAIKSYAKKLRAAHFRNVLEGTSTVFGDIEADSRVQAQILAQDALGVRGDVKARKQNPASKKPAAAKRNPSKDQIHLCQHNKRWHVLCAQNWLFISDSRAKELLAMGAVKVPWSHGKLVHHAPGKLVEDRALGLMMHNWHSGQGDSIYGVGSLLFAGKKPTAEAMQDALSNIQSLLHDKTGKFNSAGYKELKLIENNLAERIGRAQGRQVILGEPLDNPAEVVKFPRRNPTKKPAAGGIPKVQIEYIVGNIHVGEPDEVVRKNVEDRARKAGATDKLVKACGDYAVKVHQRNRNLYNDVMGGRIGSGRRRKNPAESPQARRARLRNEYPELSFTNGKIGAVSITLTRTEGGNHDLNEPHHATGGNVWAKADALLSLWGAEAAAGARNKVKFTVKYSNKETYSGTYHVSKKDKTNAHLGQHIRHTIEAALGKRKPAHMTAKQYRARLAQVKIGDKEKLARFLSEYSTGRQGNPSVLAPGQKQRIWVYSSTGKKVGVAHRDPARGKTVVQIENMPAGGKVVLKPKGMPRLASKAKKFDVFTDEPNRKVRVGNAGYQGKDIHIGFFAQPHAGKAYFDEYAAPNPTKSQIFRSNPTKNTVKSTTRKHINEAVRLLRMRLNNSLSVRDDTKIYKRVMRLVQSVSRDTGMLESQVLSQMSEEANRLGSIQPVLGKDV